MPLRHRLAGIEAARGIAAAAVAISHAALLTAEPRYYGVMPFGGALKYLAAGVDFFFVLSGFIITTVHWDDIGRADQLGRYIKRRFLRIFPFYWTILFPLIIIYQLKPSFGVPWQHDWNNVLLSIVLLPNPDMPVLGVAWTLTFEIFFYLMFGLAIAFGRIWAGMLLVWAAAIVLSHLGWADMPFPVSFLLNARNLEFLLGVSCALYLRSHETPRPAVILALGVAGFGAGLAGIPAITDQQHLEVIFTLVFGGSSGLVVLGLVSMERAGTFRSWQSVFLIAGACSYPIYLAHSVVESFAARPVMGLLGTHVSAEVIMLVLSLIGIAAGIAAHYCVEAPVTGYARRWLDAALGAARPTLVKEKPRAT